MLYTDRKVWVVVCLFLVLSFTTVLFPDFTVKAESNTIVVPDDYPTIQEAINGAVDGDTVFVRSGVYYEYLVVNKSISLVGESKETTTVYRGNQSYPNVFPTVVVRSDGVNITGFTFRNEVSAPSLIPSGAVNAYTGVHLRSVDNCNLFENIVVNSGYGIWLFDSHSNNVSENEIMNCSHGILVR